jgi:hypothetical protein
MSWTMNGHDDMADDAFLEVHELALRLLGHAQFVCADRLATV